MKRLEGWEYKYSKLLKMEYAFNPSTGVMWTEDQVRYNPDEIDLIAKCTRIVEIHNIKKIFNGELVKYENKFPVYLKGSFKKNNDFNEPDIKQGVLF